MNIITTEPSMIPQNLDWIKNIERDHKVENLEKMLRDPELSWSDIARDLGVSRELTRTWGIRLGITAATKRVERAKRGLVRKIVAPVVSEFIRRAKEQDYEADSYLVLPPDFFPRSAKVGLARVKNFICYPKFLSEPRSYVEKKRQQRRRRLGGVDPKTYWRVVPPDADYDFLCMMSNDPKYYATYILPRTVIKNKSVIYIPTEDGRKLKPAVDWTKFRNAWDLFALDHTALEVMGD